MTICPTSRQRAEWAAESLGVFTMLTFGDDHPTAMHRDDLESAVADLITNPLHYTQRGGFRPESLLQQAIHNLAAELIDEPLWAEANADCCLQA